MLKEGMKIDATHVKKKQLHYYLPADLLQKRKKVRSSVGFGLVKRLCVSEFT